MIGCDGRWTADKVAVFGAEGMLGKAVCEMLADAGHGVVALGRVDCDVTVAAQVADALSAPGLTAAINCAAFTDVDRAEDEYQHANAVNAVAPGIIARLAATHGMYMVHVSTDHVFRGDGGEPYCEYDYPAPVNAYGSSKALGESAVNQSPGDHAVVRLQWLYGGPRDFIAKIQARAVLDDKSIQVVGDMGAPTSAAHAARAIVWLMDRRRRGVWHYAASGLVSRADWARAILAATAGADPSRVKDVTAAAFPCAAPRPHVVALDCSKFDAAIAHDAFPLKDARPYWRHTFDAHMVAREGGLR